MRAVTHRGSSLPSCRTGPGPHGTWRAMPASVPQPTGAPDTACRQRRPASPRRCVGCAPYSRVRRQPHGLKDCHTLCPDTGVHHGFLLGGLWSFDHNDVQGRLQQLGIVHVCSRNHNAQGAALSIHKETALGTSLTLPRSVGLGPIRSPQSVPCPWLRLPPAIPSPRHPTLRTPPPGLPTFGARRPSPPHR